MDCERCHERPASVTFTEITNNNKKTIHLCEVCARELQSQGIVFMPQMTLHNFLASLLHGQEAPNSGFTLSPGATCPRCGLTEAQFAKGGLLGCDECYSQFGGRLEPVFKRIHGNTQHIGKVPRRTGGKFRLVKEIDRLKREMQAAVGSEEFEKAAKLRDQIRDMERTIAGEVCADGDKGGC